MDASNPSGAEKIRGREYVDRDTLQNNRERRWAADRVGGCRHELPIPLTPGPWPISSQLSAHGLHIKKLTAHGTRCLLPLTHMYCWQPTQGSQVIPHNSQLTGHSSLHQPSPLPPLKYGDQIRTHSSQFTAQDTSDSSLGPLYHGRPTHGSRLKGDSPTALQAGSGTRDTGLGVALDPHTSCPEAARKWSDHDSRSGRRQNYL